MKNDLVQDIQSRLSSLSTVRKVEVSDNGKEIKVLTDTEGLRGLATEALRAAAGPELGDTIDILLATGSNEPGRRAQFATLEVTNLQPGRLRARTVLKYEGEDFEGVAEEEATPAGEMRACANATIQAVQSFVEDSLTLTLIGAKEVHVFDHHLVAVLLHSDQHPDRRLIGTSLITDGRRRSAALAVLSATNRVVSG